MASQHACDMRLTGHSHRQQQLQPTSRVCCWPTRSATRRHTCHVTAQHGPSDGKQQRVCIIGSGAAGCTAAWSLSRFPDKYQVEVWEASNRIGGHASTLELPGGLVMNDTVLGGPYTGFSNTMALMKHLGWQTHHQDMPILFTTHQGLKQYQEQMASQQATGHDDPYTILRLSAYGTDITHSDLYKRHKHDIKRFLAALRWLWDSKQVLLLLGTPLLLLCRLLMCSDAFWSEMVAPLGVLFFGTASRMGDCPTIILASTLFNDSEGPPSIEANPETFITPKTLPIFGFPRLDLFYKTLAAAAAATGNVTYKLNHPATAVTPAGTSSSVSNSSSNNSSSSNSSTGSSVLVTDSEGIQHQFDAVIMACHATTVLQLLHKPSRLQRLAFGGVEYYTQSTILHTDEEYIKQYHPLLLQYSGPAWHVLQPMPGSNAGYELVYQFNTQALRKLYDYDASAEPAKTAAAVAAAAAGNRMLQQNSSADVIKLQRTVRTAVGYAGSSSSSSSGSLQQSAVATSTDPAVSSSSSSSSRFQTAQQQHLVEMHQEHQLPKRIWQVALPAEGAESRIAPDQILSCKTYEHPAHTVGHFLRVLALLPRVQGKDNIYYAGGWTFVDAHEFAIQGGLAAAYRLGAPYPFEDSTKAAEMFRVYLKSVHGM